MTGGPGVPATIALLLAGLAVLALAGWRSGRPADPAKGPRMIPWMMIVLAAAAWVLVMAVHLVNLFGIETGGRFGGAGSSTYVDVGQIKEVDRT